MEGGIDLHTDTTKCVSHGACIEPSVEKNSTYVKLSKLFMLASLALKNSVSQASENIYTMLKSGKK